MNTDAPRSRVTGEVAFLGLGGESSIFWGEQTKRQGPQRMSWLEGFQIWAPQNRASSSPLALVAAVAGPQSVPEFPALAVVPALPGWAPLAVGFLSRDDKAPHSIPAGPPPLPTMPGGFRTGKWGGLCSPGPAPL